MEVFMQVEEQNVGGTSDRGARARLRSGDCRGSVSDEPAGVGAGCRASRALSPRKARVKSIATHCVFGGGLYVW
jgi:hypothetical protein